MKLPDEIEFGGRHLRFSWYRCERWQLYRGGGNDWRSWKLGRIWVWWFE